MDLTEYNFSLTIHPTARSILTAYWNIPEEEWDQFLQSPMDGYDDEGELYQGSCNDMYEGILESGYWGFSEAESGVIHLWDNDSASADQVIWMIGHEVGHVLEQGMLRSEIANDLENMDEDAAEVLYEERIADLYGAICSLAYRIFMYIRNRNPETGEPNQVFFN